MVFLPIVERELRVASKRPRTYYGRMGAGAVWTILAAYFLVVMARFTGTRQLGTMLFNMLSGVLFGWAMMSAWAGADSISLEKREGTLGFLFLTDLKSHDIVLGKIVATALPAFYGALAAVPMLAICILIGGVSAGQYVKIALAILNVFFLGQAVGIFASALCRKRGNAQGVPFLVLLLYCAAFIVVSAGAEMRGWLWPRLLFEFNNPGRPFVLAMEGLSPAPPPRGVPAATLAAWEPGYWICLLVTSLHAWLFLGLAVWVLPRAWRDKPRKTDTWSLRWENWRWGNIAARLALQRKLAAINPFTWLACRKRFSPGFVWSALGTSFLVPLGFFAWDIIQEGWHQTYMGYFIFITICLQITLRLGVATHAAILEEHRRTGSLETMLCCSPMTPEDILKGMWLSLRRYYFCPLVFAVGFSLLMVFLTAKSEGGGSQKIHLICFLCVSTTLLVADLWAIAWMTLWTAMSNRRARGASAGAFFWITMMPWLGVAACSSTRWIDSEFWLWILWPLFALTNDFIVVKLAKAKLRKNFRLWASPSYVDILGFWGRLGRKLGLWRRRFAGN